MAIGRCTYDAIIPAVSGSKQADVAAII